MGKPKLNIGTAGWSYNDWVPSFYPAGKSKDFDWLMFYSEYFNVVEVNSTYYSYINPKVVKGWLEKVESKDDFSFVVKLHNDFTHKRSYTPEKVKAMRYNLDILAREERLAGVLVQFPYSFGCDDGSIEYMRKLIEEFESYNKFIEVRHKSWNKKRASSVTFCTIDQPVIGEAIEFTPVTGNDAAYIRFHGRNEEEWKKSLGNFGKKLSYEQQSERYKYLYTPGELAVIEQQIKEIYDRVKKIFVIMNNHPQGNAVANAFEMLHLLDEKSKIDIPETTLTAFPRLKKIAL